MKIKTILYKGTQSIEVDASIEDKFAEFIAAGWKDHPHELGEETEAEQRPAKRGRKHAAE
jgi:hypothetical protein